jgi:hypothetical protein
VQGALKAGESAAAMHQNARVVLPKEFGKGRVSREMPYNMLIFMDT